LLSLMSRTPSSQAKTDRPKGLRSNCLSDAPTARDSWHGRDSAVALERMVSAQELSVVFQPIVNLQDASLYAYETLVRCSRATFANPLDLFQHAVSMGCVGRLGRMIREIAVPLCSGIPLFVNVHPVELREGWLIRPDDPIFAHDDDIFLEITESVPLSQFELCMTVLREVRSRGAVHLVVDDLGAGYSNLKRISDLEPAVVKLDRELVVGVNRSPRQRQLVRSVVRLCTDMNAQVVAEGIEIPDEYHALRDTGVGYGQGFLFARPAFPLPSVSWRPAESTELKKARRIEPIG
jgi:EAL domain-containing protein (putative c-di-GMP-specific phosphodiesterase class I)